MKFMNGRKAKRINKKAKELAIEWLKTLVPEEEALKIKKPSANFLVYNGKGTATSLPLSHRDIKRKLKKLNEIEHLTLEDVGKL
jgi:hypothetical protein